jgi:membrane dipeptidase
VVQCGPVKRSTAPLFVFDSHCDVALAMLDRGVDIGKKQRRTHFDLHRARAGGIGAQFFALFADPSEVSGAGAWRRTRALLAAVESAAAAHPQLLALVTTASAIQQQRAAGRLAGLLGMEGAHGFGTRSSDLLLSRLAWLAKRGLRYLGLTWNNSNVVAGAAVDGGDGLTPLGRRVVKECERRGILVDVSHSSDATVRDVLACSKKPIIASHSNARALCDVPRNLPDELLRAIGRRGGVVSINFFPGFLSKRVADELEVRYGRWAPGVALLAERYKDDLDRRREAQVRLIRRSINGVPRATLAQVVDHVSHVARVAGRHAVGLGADYDGMLLTPDGLEDASAYPALAEALSRRFSAREVQGITGENLLRVVGEVE